MTKLFFTITLIFLIANLSAQSRKDAKKNKLKTATVTSTENGKTLFESKIVFDTNGNEIEKTD